MERTRDVVQAELAAYDQLPPDLRRAMRNAVEDFDPIEFADALWSMDEVQLIRAIRRNNAQYPKALINED